MSGYCQEGEQLPHTQLAGKSYHHYPNLLVSQSITNLPSFKNQNSGLIGYDRSKSMPDIGHSKDSRIGKWCVSGDLATYVLGAMIISSIPWLQIVVGALLDHRCLGSGCFGYVAGCDRGRGSCCSISSPHLPTITITTPVWTPVWTQAGPLLKRNAVKAKQLFLKTGSAL